MLEKMNFPFVPSEWQDILIRRTGLISNFHAWNVSGSGITPSLAEYKKSLLCSFLFGTLFKSPLTYLQFLNLKTRRSFHPSTLFEDYTWKSPSKNLWTSLLIWSVHIHLFYFEWIPCAKLFSSFSNTWIKTALDLKIYNTAGINQIQS